MIILKNKRALITGATGDIGASIARALHKSGCEIFLSGTREEALEQLVEELGSEVHYFASDLRDSKNVYELISKSHLEMGSVDILVNNAGVTEDTLFMRMTDEQWSKVIEVNLNSTMALSRGVIKNMVKARWGRIINITSIVGVTGNPGQANYAASKAGILGMSKSIALEVASRGITINCIAPGFISSAMTEKLSDEQKLRILSNIPMSRMGSPMDIASAVLFLSSEAASYITGQTLHVNGGMAMI